jgi:hypothetical protein
MLLKDLFNDVGVSTKRWCAPPQSLEETRLASGLHEALRVYEKRLSTYKFLARLPLYP